MMIVRNAAGDHRGEKKAFGSVTTDGQNGFCRNGKKTTES